MNKNLEYKANLILTLNPSTYSRMNGTTSMSIIFDHGKCRKYFEKIYYAHKYIYKNFKHLELYLHEDYGTRTHISPNYVIRTTSEKELETIKFYPVDKPTKANRLEPGRFVYSIEGVCFQGKALISIRKRIIFINTFAETPSMYVHHCIKSNFNKQFLCSCSIYG